MSIRWLSCFDGWGGAISFVILFEDNNYLWRRRQWHPTPVLLPGKSHGRRSLVGCSPWGRLDWNVTERLHFHFSLSGVGEGNGNPLQSSCLENPRDRGAWWAAVSGVSQSRTRLKRLIPLNILCIQMDKLEWSDIFCLLKLLPYENNRENVK